jgi:general secretion pathway protein G
MNLNLSLRPQAGAFAGKTRRRHRGFTLVEMLLVITIIGILAALVVPKMMGRSEQARQSAARADIASVKTALDAY